MAGANIPNCDVSGDSWVTQVKRTFDPPQTMRQLSANVCVYRIPKSTKFCKLEAYEPMVVALGPYHHNKDPKLSAMDEQKLEAVHRALKRLKGVTMSDLISEIQQQECEIRECYEEAIDLDGETLSWMLAMDACFILEFIRRFTLNRGKSDIEHLSLVFQSYDRRNQMGLAILNDILKLENQIPLFILITILELELGSKELSERELAKMLGCLEKFQGFPFCSELCNSEINSFLEIHIRKGAYHLLDLHRKMVKDLLAQSGHEPKTSSATNSRIEDCARADNMHGFLGGLECMKVPSWVPRQSCLATVSCIFRSAQETENVDYSWHTPRAELLKQAGINFKAGKARFEKRRFRSSTFFLPQITVDHDTDTVLRNLMALEECQRCAWCPEETVISHYIRLLEDLIDTDTDVSILKKANIIKSWLGSDEEIARIFNHFGKGITIGSVEQFQIVGQQARKHYHNRWKVWISLFKKQHCSNPWYITSLVAAIILLSCTIVQTIYAVKN